MTTMTGERPTAEWEHVLEPEDRFWLFFEVRSPVRRLAPFRINVEVSLATYRQRQAEGYDTPDMTLPLDHHWWKSTREGGVWITRGGFITRYGEKP